MCLAYCWYRVGFIGGFMEHPNPERKWQNMRRMAWTSLYASLLYPLLVLCVNDPKPLMDIASVFYLLTGSVIGAYMGWSTWGDKK